MYDYVKESNTLVISKIPIPREHKLQYSASHYFRSYQLYLDTVREDFEYLVKKLNEIVKSYTSNPMHLMRLESFSIKKANQENTFSGQGQYEYYVSISSGDCSIAFTDDLARKKYEFPLLAIPFMDVTGVLSKSGSKYNLINKLIQDGTSYEYPQLKIATNETNIIFTVVSGKVKYEMDKKKFDAFELAVAFAKLQGFDINEVKGLFGNTKVNNYFGDPTKEKSIIAENLKVAYAYDECIKARMFERFIDNEKFHVGKYRPELNEILSLNRALNQILYADVTLIDGSVISKGTKVTQAHLDLFNESRINSVMVFDTQSYSEAIIKEMIHIPIIRRGSKVIESIIDIYPESERDNMYVSKDYIFTMEDTPIILPGTITSNDLINMLVYNGHSGMRVSESLTSSQIIDVHFYREIIGNNTFLVNTNSHKEWIYVDVNGSEVACSETFTFIDIVAIISLILRLDDGEDLNTVTSRDLGLLKRVASTKELFREAFRKAADSHCNMIRNRLLTEIANRNGTEPTTDFLLDVDKMTSIFAGFSKKWWAVLQIDMKVLRPIDTTNPAAFASNNNRIETIVKDSKAVGKNMRAISMHHYGRICVYEIAQSRKLGLTNTKALGCEIDDNGLMYTSYYKVKQENGKSFITNEIVKLSPLDERSCIIADITSLDIDDSTGEITNKKRILARVPNINDTEKMTVASVNRKYLTHVNVDPHQHLSSTATTIPFFGNDDPVRTSFGLNMCRQAKGIIHREVPTVITSGFYDIPRSNTFYQICAEESGEVVEVQPNALIVIYDKPVDMTYRESPDGTTFYYFQSVEFTKDTVILRKALVKEGDRFEKGQELVTSNFIEDGVMAIGVNALCAWIPVAYDYEDAVYESERLCVKLASYGSHVEEAPLNKAVREVFVKSFDRKRYFRRDECICNIKSLKDVKNVRKPDAIESSITSKNISGFMIEIRNLFREDKLGRPKSIQSSSISFDPADGGDKLANRHGNKGTIPKRESNILMPRFSNGEFIDLVYNQMGAISRMNIGQIKEAHLGLVGHILRIKLRSDSLNGASVEDVAELLEFSYKLANEDFDATLNEYKSVFPSALIRYIREQKDWIKSWANTFDKFGTAELYNPKTGKNYRNRVVVGINYVYKLIHESAKKLAVRGGMFSGEPYNRKTGAPTEGASLSGGQKAGTMEIDGLSAYGASAVIQERMNVLGDNLVVRNNHNVDILHAGDNFKLDEKKAIRRSSEYFINIAQCLGIDIEFKDGILPNFDNDDLPEAIYTVKALKSAKIVGKRKSTSEDNAENVFDDYFDRV